MDKFSLIGVVLGLFAIFGGAMMEGVHLSAIIIPTAAIIVFGGTIGAVLLQSSTEEIHCAVGSVKLVFQEPRRDAKGLVAEIVELSRVARRDGMLALEGKLAEMKHPFLGTAVGMLIDGVAAEELRSRLEIATATKEERFANGARVFEGAGGYSPTVGILGAVLGLIHVMGSLDDPSKLGPGIAVAFVATIYGVAFANLICLPIAGKLKARARAETAEADLIIEGVVGMAEGQASSSLEQTLNLMLGESGEGKRSATEAPAQAA